MESWKFYRWFLTGKSWIRSVDYKKLVSEKPTSFDKASRFDQAGRVKNN